MLVLVIVRQDLVAWPEADPNMLAAQARPRVPVRIRHGAHGQEQRPPRVHALLADVEEQLEVAAPAEVLVLVGVGLGQNRVRRLHLAVQVAPTWVWTRVRVDAR